jgi:site-specific recombinase XerC
MNKPISPLRQRMIDDMTMRNLSANTQETYIRSVAQLSAFHRRLPDQLGVEHLRDFHLHLVSRGLVANSISVKMAAFRHRAGRIIFPRFSPAKRLRDCSRRWATASCERR